MAITTTALSAAISADVLTFKVTSTTGFAAGYTLIVDQEFSTVVEVVSSTQVRVRSRGDLGTSAVIHGSGAPVSCGPAADFPAIPIGEVAPIPPDATGFVALGALPLAIPVPDKDTLILLNSGAATAYTLVDPTPSMQGRRLTLQANTAHAYTVTSGSEGFNGGGTNSDVATFGGAKGDNFVIRASATQWLVEDLRNVTLG